VPVVSRKRIRQLHSSQDVDGLVRLMQEVSTGQRVAIIATLSRVGTPEAEAGLMEALSDSSPFVRGLAIGELTRIDPDRDPEPILRALSDDGSPVGELSAEDVVRADLHRLRALDTVPILIRGLGSEDHRTRAQSASALGELADPRGETALAAAAADDQRRSVRNAAREALEKTRSASVGS
jgi:HEAT repeat protein